MILEVQDKGVFEQARFVSLEPGDTVKLVSKEVLKESDSHFY